MVEEPAEEEKLEEWRWRLKSHLFLAVLDFRVREREIMRANFGRIKCQFSKVT
jgi:hypothetical protein